jgi:hypothetical protein
MVILDASISSIPFELHGSELLLKGLLARYPKAFRRMANRFEAGDDADHIVLIPEKKGKIRFFKSGNAIGLSYIRPSGGSIRPFSNTFGQILKDTLNSDSCGWTGTHNGLIQKGMHPMLANQLKGLLNEDF